mmetsp:Transcript_9505/g.24822  ORF Transcript_9505/g.24822 Transcript_9505/m.24822 type:complete len:282 (-) Transcript_9505:149-994(-)
MMIQALVDCHHSARVSLYAESSPNARRLASCPSGLPTLTAPGFLALCNGRWMPPSAPRCANLTRSAPERPPCCCGPTSQAFSSKVAESSSPRLKQIPELEFQSHRQCCRSPSGVASAKKRGVVPRGLAAQEHVLAQWWRNCFPSTDSPLECCSAPPDALPHAAGSKTCLPPRCNCRLRALTVARPLVASSTRTSCRRTNSPRCGVNRPSRRKCHQGARCVLRGAPQAAESPCRRREHRRLQQPSQRNAWRRRAANCGLAKRCVNLSPLHPPNRPRASGRRR